MKRLLQKSLNVEDFRDTRKVIASLDVSLLLEHFSLEDIPMNGEAYYVDIPGVTMVFDLAGSSASIRQKGPISFVDQYAKMFDRLTSIIYNFEGIIEKFPGDGISVHFLKREGETTLNEAHTRAIKASIEIVSYMNAQGYAKDYRISMWTGKDTIATIIGNSHHKELISVGHGVNVAHKLEKVIKDARCYIGMDEPLAQRYRLLGGRLSTESYLGTEIGGVGEKWYGVRQ